LTASHGSLASNQGDQSYRIPTHAGTYLPADPIKFCLRFRPPTIAIVYQPHARPQKKYVREFELDLKEDPRELEATCERLFERERDYFNP
jgi:hypothetical protein